MQPTYLPWLGYFDLIDTVDIFVLLDNVKLEKSSWHVRNRIRSSAGETVLTVPVSLTKSRLDTMINETAVNMVLPWAKKHLKSIEQNYCKTVFFDDFFPKIEKTLSLPIHHLSELNAALISTICNYIEITTPITLTSEMAGITGTKSHRLVSICQHLMCDDYYSPKGSAAYLDEEKHGGALTDAGINVTYQDFIPVEYAQQFNPFIPYLSAIDTIFNVGPDQTRELIKLGNKTSFNQI